MIVFSRENFCETSNSLFHGYEFAGMACEYLSDLERLRKETLNLTCTCNGKLVFFRQLVHTFKRECVSFKSPILALLLRYISSVSVQKGSLI